MKIKYWHVAVVIVVVLVVIYFATNNSNSEVSTVTPIVNNTPGVLIVPNPSESATGLDPLQMLQQGII
jgi:hypothetical protein